MSSLSRIYLISLDPCTQNGASDNPREYQAERNSSDSTTRRRLPSRNLKTTLDLVASQKQKCPYASSERHAVGLVVYIIKLLLQTILGLDETTTIVPLMLGEQRGYQQGLHLGRENERHANNPFSPPCRTRTA